MGAGGASAGDITPNEIEMRLRARVDSLVPKLLPKAIKEAKYWSIGSVDGEPGTQMKINRAGRTGLWTDYSEAKGSDRYSGDLLMLIAAVEYGGWSREGAKAKAIGWAKNWLGLDDMPPAERERTRREAEADNARRDEEAEAELKRKRSQAWMIWRASVPVAGTPAESYLRGRLPGLERLGRWPGSLRFLPDLWCPVRRGKHPAMIAQIRPLAGDMLGVHRTWLDVSRGKDGPVTAIKVVADPATKRMRIARPGEPKAKSHKASLGPYAGGCIPLWQGRHAHTLREIPAGTPVYVSEGIEDGLTIAVANPDARIVAGVALANMGGLILPAQAGPLIFIGQRDPIDGRAIEAFEAAIARQQRQAAAQGRPMPQVIWPEPGFKDFNDQLLGRRMGE